MLVGGESYQLDLGSQRVEPPGHAPSATFNQIRSEQSNPLKFTLEIIGGKDLDS